MFEVIILLFNLDLINSAIHWKASIPTEPLDSIETQKSLVRGPQGLY